MDVDPPAAPVGGGGGGALGGGARPRRAADPSLVAQVRASRSWAGTAAFFTSTDRRCASQPLRPVHG